MPQHAAALMGVFEACCSMLPHVDSDLDHAPLPIFQRVLLEW